jgi:5'-methylthioadenosine/S-adenosylhomocysteine nucleosidase
MKNELKIGLVVADDMEYAAYEELISSDLKENNFYGRKGHRYEITVCNKKIIIDSILCGIGTVNASAAAMHLVNNGADVLLNYGLSGGISNVSRGEDVVGSSFLEYDFDLTCCGYKPCEKPAQEYIYTANEILCNIISKQGGGLKKAKLASGDKFVSDPVLRDLLKNEFGINACDMETAAIAYVAHLTDTPFASLRRVSDDAGVDATEDYHDMNNKPMTDLPEILMKSVNLIFHESVFWE